MSLPGPFDWKNSIKLNNNPIPSTTAQEFRDTMYGYDNLAVAIVDLSDGRFTTFSQRFRQTGYGASMVKIAAMYAAYYLQDRVKIVAPLIKSDSLAVIESTLRKEWEPMMKATVPRPVGDFPDISKIFQPRTFKFSNWFRSNLIEMIKHSENWSSAACIHSIGYDYMNGALVHGGFYSVADNSGIYLSGDYLKPKYAQNRDGLVPKGLNTQQAASAEGVGLMMANLANDRLISADASKRMKVLMGSSLPWARSAIQATEPGAEVYEKIGYHIDEKKNYTASDCAIVKHNHAHYAFAVLFAESGIDPMYPIIDRFARTQLTIGKIVNAVSPF